MLNICIKIINYLPCEDKGSSMIDLPRSRIEVLFATFISFDPDDLVLEIGGGALGLRRYHSLVN